MNPDVKKKLQGAIKEIDIALSEIDASKEHIKDIIEKICDEHDELEKKVVRKLARIYHKQNLAEVEIEGDIVVNTYKDVFGD